MEGAGGNYLPISIVIPVYNEEENLAMLFPELMKLRERLLGVMDPEIVVVDDGSSDGSVDVARKYRARVIQCDANCGKGNALRKGLREARGSLIITMDGDYTHDPLEALELIKPLLKDEADMVIGSRFAGVVLDGSIPPVHRIGNRLIRIASLFLHRRYIMDSQSGFRSFRRGILDEVRLDSDGFTIDSEITFKSLRAGARIIEVPVTCRKRVYGNTRLSTFRDGLKILLTMLMISLRLPTPF